MKNGGFNGFSLVRKVFWLKRLEYRGGGGGGFFFWKK